MRGYYSSFDVSNNFLSGVIPSGIMTDYCYKSPYNEPSYYNNYFCSPYPFCMKSEDIDSQDTSNCP